MIRVLVAEDSAVAREHLSHVLETDGRLQIVATAEDGVQAVEQVAAFRPDVVLMDIHMPRLNGYEATRRVMEQTPTPIVLVTGSYDRADVEMSLQALEAGALTVVEKPAGPHDATYPDTARRLVDSVRLMSEVKVVRRYTRVAAASRQTAARMAMTAIAPGEPDPVPSSPRPTRRVIAIGASTGGPTAVARLLKDLGSSIGVPILVAQHIAPGFAESLSSWLQSSTRLPVKIATQGESLKPGCVYLATEQTHLGVDPAGRIQLSNDPPELGFRPSVTHLFRSVTQAYGPAAVGVLLTGMGRDGATGLQEMRAAGAITIAQNQETSAVFGMPGEAVRLGAATYVLSLDRIAQLLAALTKPALHALA
jgi:two-component system chemotaxis response regulator CheB